MATGNFVMLGGTADDARYRAAGTIEGTMLGLATLEGVDADLC
jgi:hypothetical protein